MKFLDTNVFVYAYYKPKKQLSQKEKQMKEEAQKIISAISQGKEEALLTVIHISEIVNILKHGMPIDQLLDLIRGLFMLDNVRILDVTKEAYFTATELGEDLKLEPNDALAVYFMTQNGVKEIYSFNEDFNKIKEITRLPKI